MGAGLWMAWTAFASVHSVDRLLARPDAVSRLAVKELGGAHARPLLEYQAAEFTRSEFETWETAQILLGGFFFFYLLFATDEGKYALLLALLMIAAVLLERLLLTPEVVSLGRSTDFTPAVSSADRARLMALRVVYGVTEVFKWAAAVLLAVKLISHHRDRSGSSRRDLFPASRTAHGQVQE